ncbi:MAG: HIT family protein [Planctomycetota bacterium]
MERKNLWAPWRIGYIHGLSDELGVAKNGEAGGCFFCRYLEQPEDDDKNYVLWRTEHCIVVLNRFPYNNGHLLIAPVRHIPDLGQASEAEMLEMTKLFRETQRALGLAINPHGFNLGMNIGRCAGAGLPEHLHVHLVPRWNGDTNFMTVCNDTDVISQSLQELFDLLKKISAEHNLPSL